GSVVEVVVDDDVVVDEAASGRSSALWPGAADASAARQAMLPSPRTRTPTTAPQPMARRRVDGAKRIPSVSALRGPTLTEDPTSGHSAPLRVGTPNQPPAAV